MPQNLLEMLKFVKKFVKTFVKKFVKTFVKKFVKKQRLVYTVYGSRLIFFFTFSPKNVELDKSGACYVVFPDCPLIDFPNVSYFWVC